MNEQIEKLLAQAHIEFAPDSKAVTSRFAELLVKKCAIIANRADNTETEIRCMYDVITEHFGIE